MSRRKHEANLHQSHVDFLDRAFNYHAPPNDDIVKMHEQARETCRSVAAMVMHLPQNREQAYALQCIEEAMMWVNACIAREHKAILNKLAEQRAKAEAGG